VSVGNGYSVDARMQFAGQKDPKIFNKSYNHKNRVSGVDSYWGRKKREDHLSEIRVGNLPFDPQLSHRLPAQQRYELEQTPAFRDISRELEDLQFEKQKDPPIQEICDRNKIQSKLYEAKRQLIREALAEWQKNAKGAPTATQESSPYTQSMFERTRRLDPVRGRLAENLFLDVPLRSETGSMVIKDMILLCRGAPEVAYRPSCQPTEKGQCPECATDMDRYVGQ
jgi:hypothetical protein